MTDKAKPNFGDELWLAPSGKKLVKVAELITVTPPASSRAMIDATTHDSPDGAQEFIPEGTFNPGQMTGQVNYIGGSDGDKAMVLAFTSAAKQDFALRAKGDAAPNDPDGSCYVMDYKPDARPTTGKKTASFTLQVTGAFKQPGSAGANAGDGQ